MMSQNIARSLFICVVLLLIVGYLSVSDFILGDLSVKVYKESTSKETIIRSRESREEYAFPAALAPCGEICSYQTGVEVQSSASVNSGYPLLRKSVDCNAMMRRMAYRNHIIQYPPPETPPPDVHDAFTMNGDMPVQRYNYFKTEFAPNATRHFPASSVLNNIANVHNLVNVNCYKGGVCVQDALRNYSQRIQGQRGVVIGSRGPWLESVLLAYGARNVTTLEYEPLSTDFSQLDSYTPYEFAESYLRGEVEPYDVGASFSSLEHSGLGRYTDPINPYGDLEAMAQVWCMIKPGGLFGLGVPSEGPSENFIVWNAHRSYGDKRLQHFTANWEVLERRQCENHVFLVLQKPLD